MDEPKETRKSRSRIPVAILLLLAWFAAIGAARAETSGVPSVLDLRLGTHPGYTRFVLELDSPLAFQVYALPNPYRVVIDMPEVGWQLPKETQSHRAGSISGFRYGLFRPGQSRVVLDAIAPVGIRKALVLPPGKGLGYRFVLDMETVSEQAFRKGVGQASARAVVAAAPKGRPPAPLAAESAKPAVHHNLPDDVILLARLGPPKTKPLDRLRKRVVVLDPGHGGIDPGAIGVSGIHEKNITLAMAREVRQRLEKTGRYKVILTRNRDVFIRLRDRVSYARDKGGEIFVSLHADTIRNKRIRGLSVYTLSEKASDKEAALLADKENKADLIAGVDLTHESDEVTNILIDLAQRETMNQSVQFAAQLVRELKRETKLLRNTHRFAGFAVLKAPDIPSVLVELGFLSNRKDEAALRDSQYRSKLARAIAKGIDGYFVQVEEAIRR
ncbi:N-acetylmuramoyl-L-alanine amidase [Magnetospira sp. QH-2]|uniref:N-acetylmuramoyl-L-alanine amidase n=1 Tax=Magnetospira sp. (strain QH-2) TaxID=1288970 RepID=UPI0005FA88F3|nr:N-acetylmuramoyl-L-alanine amidase [Magnetospira sp. QH-2]